MKILSAPQIRDADAYTIENEPVSSINLMERASQAFVKQFISLYPDQGKPIVIFAGTGNNGGDGLAIGRLLLEEGYKVEANVIRVSDKSSADFDINYNRLKSKLQIHEITKVEEFPALPENCIIIDAIFGSGLSRPAEGLFRSVIDEINKNAHKIVAVDIASGLFSDQPTSGDHVIHANQTISFQVPKLAFLLRQNSNFVGDWYVVDIGLSQQYIGQIDHQYTYLDEQIVRKYIKPRNKYDHKGNFGRVLIISGSYGKMGAAILCCRAALKAGVGLLTVHVPECGYQIIQTTVPEAMATIDPSVQCFSEIPPLDSFETFAVGPGIGTNQKTAYALEKLLTVRQAPMVIDADALNILGMHKELLGKIPRNSILTPHPKEFERIAGPFSNDFERLDLQKSFARKHHVNLIVKGAHTSITTPEGHIYFNSTGNPGMATAGSGDVLTGILTALLAQYKDPLAACILGTYLHGLSGDLARKKMGEEALTSSDIIDYLPDAFLRLRQNN